MQTVLLVVQLLIAVALIAVIMIQRTAQDGGGLMGGGATMGGLFTARGSANLLTRTTAVLATLFILNCLALGYLASAQHQGKSLIDRAAEAPVTTPLTTPVTTPGAPSAPAIPVTPATPAAK